MKFAVFLAGCLATAPVVALNQDGNVITLTDDELQACADEGGCYVVTKANLVKALEQVKARTLKTCGGRT